MWYRIQFLNEKRYKNFLEQKRHEFFFREKNETNTSTLFVSERKDDSKNFSFLKFFSSFFLEFFFYTYHFRLKIKFSSILLLGSHIWHGVPFWYGMSWISRNDCKENDRIKYFNQIKHLCMLWWKQSKILPASTCSHVILIRLQSFYAIW